jgi:hypothetical protein
LRNPDGWGGKRVARQRAVRNKVKHDASSAAHLQIESEEMPGQGEIWGGEEAWFYADSKCGNGHFCEDLRGILIGGRSD